MVYVVSYGNIGDHTFMPIHAVFLLKETVYEHETFVIFVPATAGCTITNLSSDIALAELQLD